MRAGWICPSCRRKLYRNIQRSERSLWSQKSTYIPFDPSTKASLDVQAKDLSQSQWHGKHQSKRDDNDDWRDTVEDEFVRRIRETNTPNRPYSRNSHPLAEDRPGHASLDAENNEEESDIDRLSFELRSRIYGRNVVRQRPNSKQARDLAHSLRSNFRRLIPFEQDDSENLPSQSYTRVAADSHAIDSSDAVQVARTAKEYAEAGRRASSGVEKLQHGKVRDDSFFDQFFQEARASEPQGTGAVPAIRNALENLKNAHAIVASKPGLESGIEEDGIARRASGKDMLHAPTTSDEQLEEVAPMEPASKLEPVKSDTDSSPKHSSAVQSVMKNIAEKTISFEAWEDVIQTPAYQKTRLSSRALTGLCKKFARLWCTDDPTQVHGHRPSPSSIFNELSPGLNTKTQALLATELLWTVLVHAINISRRAAVVGARNEQQQILGIMEMWDIIIKQFGECYVRNELGTIERVSGHADWDIYLQSEQMLDSTVGSSEQTKMSVLHFFPVRPVRPLRYLDTAAMATERLLAEHYDKVNTATGSFQKQRMFFERLNARRTPLTKLEISTHEQVLKSRCMTEEDAFAILEDIVKVLSRQSQGIPPPEEKGSTASTITPVTAVYRGDPHDQLDTIKKRIGRAIEENQIHRLERTWADAQKVLEKGSNVEAKAVSQMYAQFLMAFMAVGLPNRAIAAWNYMSESGVEPSVEHWDAMLRGCGVNRNAGAVLTMWERLIESGISPDARLWATKIHALGVSGRIEAALETFRSMAQAWLEAQEPSHRYGHRPSRGVDEPAKPNTQCLNALVGILARANRHEQLAEAFEWRRKLGIEADSYTYNPLLRAAFRDNNLDLASKLFQQMHGRGINPDVATYTMMLNAVFLQPQDSLPAFSDIFNIKGPTSGESDPLRMNETSQEPFALQLPAATPEQQSAVAVILNHMASRSLKPTAHTFSTLVSGLLHSNPPNIKAAYGILQYLSIHSLPRSPQIYTSLMTYHFEQHPPDLVAVEGLWHHARELKNSKHPVILDGVFYDRCIIGWAQSGQLQRALQVRRAAQVKGKYQSWGTLQILIESLLSGGDWRAADHVVQETKREEAEAGEDQVRGGKGFAAFWHMVNNLGMNHNAEDVHIADRDMSAASA